MNTKEYYQKYWQKRINRTSVPIPENIPEFLNKYTAYGAILNQIPPGANILDLGTGDGNVSQLYLKKGSVTGLDISQAALNIAKRKGIITVNHDLNDIPYPLKANSFQVVILTDVIEHLIDPLKVLGECRRLLKKSGVLILTVPNFARIGNRFRMIFGDPTDILHFDKYGDGLEHLQWFTRPKLEYLFSRIGFRNYKFIPTGLKNFNFIFGLLGLPQLGQFLTVNVKK